MKQAQLPSGDMDAWLSWRSVLSATILTAVSAVGAAETGRSATVENPEERPVL